VAFAPIHRPLVLAAASFDGTIAIWEQQQSTTFAMSASTSDTPTTMNNTTHLNHSWECTAQLEGHENEVKCVEWNATGSLLATCGRDKVRCSMCVRIAPANLRWTHSQFFHSMALSRRFGYGNAFYQEPWAVPTRARRLYRLAWPMPPTRLWGTVGMPIGNAWRY
jgi:WD40 repeat protein